MVFDVEGEMTKRLVKQSSSGREAPWRARLGRFSKAGQTVAAFCAAESVSVPSFYYWRSKLGGRDGATRERRLVSAAGFIEVGPAQRAAPRYAGGGAVAEAVVTRGVELQLDLGGGVLLQIRRF